MNLQEFTESLKEPLRQTLQEKLDCTSSWLEDMESKASQSCVFEFSEALADAIKSVVEFHLLPISKEAHS